MPSKRKRGYYEEPTTRTESSSETLTEDAAQLLIRRLLTEFNIDPTLLAAEDGRVSFSNAAPLVGLDPDLELQDISTFEVHRSRISTELFKSIVEDMDVMLVQYGPPHVHETEEARSRFFSPIFNHLVKQFTFMLRNYPETMITGRVDTGSRIKCFFKAFGAIAILCIEMKLKVGNVKERLDAIGQVITECNGCNLNNSKRAFSLPILCILSDGPTFEFFKFEKAGLVSSFFRGCFPADPESLPRGLTLPDPESYAKNPLPFILQLRCVCEMIFDTMLNAYISALSAYRHRSASTGERKGLKRPSTDGLDQALKFAEDALKKFRTADSQRKDGNIDSADTSVLEGFHLLHESTGAVPTVYKSKLIMTGWDENEVNKA